MSEFSRLMEHQNIPACTKSKSISLLQVLNLKMGTMYTDYRREKKKKKKIREKKSYSSRC